LRVVIGIISVLISMLLPALGKVRDQAQSTACLSHLRQIGVALQLYAGQNRDYLPYVGDWGTTYRGKQYDALPLERSIAGAIGGKRQPDGSIKPSPITLCPAAREFSGGLKPMTRSYSAHPRLMPDFQYLASSGAAMRNSIFGGTKYSKVRRSSEIMLIFEGTQQLFDEGWNTPGNTDSTAYNLDSSRVIWDRDAFLAVPGTDLDASVITYEDTNRDSFNGGDLMRGHIRWRHFNGSGTNVLFADGHAASLRAKTAGGGGRVVGGGDIKRRNLYLNP
jgi:prepilin-type processing-associated H-X9-DG protein